MCLLRDQPAEFGMATLLQSLPYRQWIVGVGLDSDEQGNPPEKFAGVFRRARAEGYQITMHCDTDQENSLEHIRQCLEVIEVDRIDHGVNILESESLTADLRRRGLGLTVCPISNRWCTGDLGGYVTDNLIATQQAAGLQVADLVRLQRNAIEIAWLPATVREQLLAEIDQYRAGATEPDGP